MSAFLGRGKGKFKRDKNANSDWTADYLDADKLKQKYTEKAKTTWNECEYLYAARVSRCSRRSASAGALVESDAVLALFHIPQSAGVSIACFECGQTVELGLHEPLEDIRKIENDGAPTDVSCTMADSEILWRMNSHTERDEFVWILCQLSKHMTGLSIPVLGYVPDIDLRAGGLEIKYPYLHKLLNAELASLVHVEDEREAELLLEQLDWTKPVPELQAHLHDDILLLNVEICDLLLQWEEDEDKSRPQHAASRVRDTVELLTTLNHVDKELGFVDDWLGNQINHLSEVQAEIKQIESESGTLETSLQNLTAVKSLISSLTQNLQLSRAHEDILINAEKNLKSLMVSGSLSSAEVDGAVDPIISALEALRRALATNEDSLNIVDHSKEDWDHLKLVSGIMDQRQKLSGIVASFSSSAGEFLVSLFASILRHKALTDSSKQNSIIVRKFSFSTAQFEVFVCSGRVPSSLSIENRMSIMRTKNQVLSSQRCFQESLVSFLPVYEHTVHLNPVLRFRIIKSYIDAVQQFLYGPLLRQLFKEMSSVVSVQNTVCFASLPRTKARRLGTKTVPLQRFHEVGALSSSSALGVKGGGLNSQGATAFHIWDSMLLAILLVSPVIDREKAFFEGIIPSTGPDERSDRSTAVDEIFSIFHERMIKIVSSSDQVNAMEIVAVLSFVDSILKYHDTITQSRDVASMLIEDEVIDAGPYSIPSSFRLPRLVVSILMESREILERRLNDFIADEVNWIQSGKGGLSDAKMLGVFPAFQKFPLLLDVVEELTGSQPFSFSEKLVLTLGTNLLKWIFTCAAMNEKYQDAILIQNLAFFELCINSRATYSSYQVLTTLLDESNSKRFEAEKHYLDWMIAYEMPLFASLSAKIDGVEKRANRDEMSLYVRRQEVIKVISALDVKSVESYLAAMRKRLDKHFNTQEAMELALISRMWVLLQNRMNTMFVSMTDIVHASYQLSFALKPEQLLAIFDKNK